MIKYSKDFQNILTSLDSITADLNIQNELHTLYNPINYLFSQKGKKIRGILVLLSNQLFNDNIKGIKELILGIESLHNFTLIHDDVMDNAFLRRGAPTINKKWSVNQAVLSGDVLLIYAYKHLLESKAINKMFLRQFTETAIKICEGQQLDLDMQINTSVNLNDYHKMIDAKTGALIQLALTSPCYLTEIGNIHLNNMSIIGYYLGQLFQIQDDYLDLYGEEEKTGKVKGGDVLENKKTFLYAVALNAADSKQTEKLATIYHSKNDDKLSDIITLYSQLNVKENVQKELEKLSSKIFELINGINVNNDKKRVFVEFVNALMIRRN